MFTSWALWLSTILHRFTLKIALNSDNVEHIENTHTDQFGLNLCWFVSFSFSFSVPLSESVFHLLSFLATIRPVILFDLLLCIFVLIFTCPCIITFVCFVKCDLIECNISSAVLVRIWSSLSPIWKNWSWQATTFRNWWVHNTTLLRQC